MPIISVEIMKTIDEKKKCKKKKKKSNKHRKEQEEEQLFAKQNDFVVHLS